MTPPPVDGEIVRDFFERHMRQVDADILAGAKQLDSLFAIYCEEALVLAPDAHDEDEEGALDSLENIGRDLAAQGFHLVGAIDACEGWGRRGKKGQGYDGIRPRDAPEFEGYVLMMLCGGEARQAWWLLRRKLDGSFLVGERHDSVVTPDVGPLSKRLMALLIGYDMKAARVWLPTLPPEVSAT